MVRNCSLLDYSLWPPSTSTKAILTVSDLSLWPSLLLPEFTGRMVAALAKEKQMSLKSGKALFVRELAEEFHLFENN